MNLSTNTQSLYIHNTVKLHNIPKILKITQMCALIFYYCIVIVVVNMWCVVCVYMFACTVFLGCVCPHVEGLLCVKCI